MLSTPTRAVRRSLDSDALDVDARRLHPGTTSPPLRVLFVTPRFLPFVGGVENHVYEVARRMVHQNTAVTVLTTDPGGSLAARELIEGVSVRRVPAYPADKDYYLAPGLYRAITGGEWDLVHVQSYHTLVAPLAMYAARRARIPYIVTFHGGGHSSAMRNRARGIQQTLLRPLLARAERLVTIAKFEQNFFQEQLRLPAGRFVMIPNGADLPRLRKEEQPETDKNLIASVGRLERYKGHHRVIAALPYALREKPNLRLWIAGTGPFEPELRQLAAKLGVADHVGISAVPPGARQEMARKLSETALVVLLSEYESHPLSILEALSLGRPVLVSNTSGLGELVERGYARGIAPDSSPQAIASAILEQLERPCVPAALELPTWDACAEKLLELYRSVVRRKECAF